MRLYGAVAALLAIAAIYEAIEVIWILPALAPLYVNARISAESDPSSTRCNALSKARIRHSGGK